MTKYYAKIVVEIEAESGSEAFQKAEEMGDLISVGMNKEWAMNEG